MGLNDAEVKKQIDHMIAFIDQEANEKVDEINAKADEEFEIEKSRLVQQQRQKIISAYERKEKHLEQQRKVQQSQLVNQARLRILKHREEQIESILTEARNQLTAVSQDTARYQELLLGLITQGLFQLLEDRVIIQCREADKQLVQAVVPEAIARFKDATKRDVEIYISDKRHLDEDSCGGVKMTSQSGNITVENTLNARLAMIGQQMMPEIREVIFGKNMNRKFLD